MKENILRFLESLQPYKYRLIGFFSGLIIAILFLTIGFFKTLLVLICVGIGFIIGYFYDDKADLSDLVDRVLSRVKGEK